MEARELMIGDLVTYKNEPPIAIYSINESFVDGFSICDIVNYNKNDGTYIRADKVSPIQLTLEFLKKNGFRADVDGTVFRHSYDEGDFFFVINIEMLKDGWFVDSHSSRNISHGLKEVTGRIQYVHELQHIFKMLDIKKDVIV